MQCRVCDSSRLDLAINLGEQPWCNHFLKPEEVGKEPYYPLRVLYCQDCGTAQLDYTVKKEIMFGDHTYLSGVTKSLSAHFENVAHEVDERFFAGKTEKSVLDIGSNDGTQLKHFQALGYDVLGVESSKTTAKIANDAGVPTLNDFFNLDVVKTLGRKFSAINAAGVFFHLEELHSVTEGIREALADDGVFVVQFLYMKRIVENLAFDQIYHEHLLYYNLNTIEVLLNRHGLSMFDAYLSPIHGGSII
ncbi:MAG: class I SAM-dependent methyltransferase, partial [Synechocystis sp.]